MLQRLAKVLSKAATAFTAVVFALMTIVVLLGVFYRYVIVSPLPWAEDLGRYLMVLMALFGAGAVLHNRAHVAVTALVDRLPERPRLMVFLLARALVAAFALVMVYLAVVTLKTMRPQISSTLFIDLWWVFLGFPFYGGLLAVEALSQIQQDWQKLRDLKTAA